MRVSLPPVFATLLLLGACVRTKVSVLDPSIPRTPTCEEGIIEYDTPASAPAGYSQVALIQSTAGAQMSSASSMRKSMRKKAASVGATGIILTAIDSLTPASTIARTAIGLPARHEGMALAIFAKSDSARVSRLCAER